MATYFLPPVLKKLRAKAPGLQIEIIASNEMSDLRQREADIAKMQFVGFDDPERRLGLMASRRINLTPANFNFLTASVTLSVALIRQGYGIGILPVEIGEAYPERENPYPKFAQLKIETWLVAHRELRTNLRIRMVFDVLAEGLGK